MKQKASKQKQTLVNMMRAGKAELERTSSPRLAWEAAKKQNDLPPTFWDRYIAAAMEEGMWYALSTKK